MAALEDIVLALREIADPSLPNEIAARAAGNIEEALRGTLTAGTTPEGVAWAARKKDSGRAYANAPAALTVAAFGNLVRATITGPTAYGQFGVAGAPVRLMLPDAGAAVPPSISKAISEALNEVMAEKVK